MTEAVHDLRIGLEELAGEDRRRWAPLAHTDRLRDVVGIAERTEIERIRTVAEWDSACAWAEDGAVSPFAWLRHNFAMNPAEAGALMHLARFYAHHRPIRDGLDGGTLALAAVRLMLKASRRREDAFAACVEGMVRLAGEVSLGEFATEVARWVDLVDDQAPKDHSKRDVSITGLGEESITTISGAHAGADIIRAYLEAVDHPDPADAPDGPRTRGERWYDHTIDLFRRGLADELGEDPMTLGNLDVIVDAQTAAEIEADVQPSLEDALQPFQAADVDELRLRMIQHPDGRPATRALVAAMLCTGLIRRIIIDPATGATLDVGRAQRRFTKRQTRALAIRDGGCAFPGCDRPPRWCDAHHLKEWENHGRTDLDNGCLLCRRHHTLIHHKGWSLRRDPVTGVFTATAPDGRQFTREPRQRQPEQR